MNREELSTFPKSIPAKYHSILLQQVYDQFGLLANAVAMTNGALERLEVKVDLIEQDVAALKLDVAFLKKDVGEIKETFATKKDLTNAEQRIRAEFRKEMDPVKKDVVKLKKEVFE